MDLVFSTVTQLAAAIQAGEVRAVAVLDAYLAQLARHNPTLNAIVTIDAERARARAQAADAALARGEVWGPLHGVPFTLKDAFATAGMRTTTGVARRSTTSPTMIVLWRHASKPLAAYSSGKPTWRPCWQIFKPTIPCLGAPTTRGTWHARPAVRVAARARRWRRG